MIVAGIVLCGGQSKRMGQPKAWLPFAGELMLPRVARLLGEAAAPVVVVAAKDQAIPPLPRDVEIVRDEEADRGPLQGLAAGLAAVAGRADAVFLSSCDVPFLRPAFVRRMVELLGERQACVAKTGEYLHPLAAVYRVDVLPVVRKLLRENRLRPALLFDEVATRIVSAEELLDADPNLETLRNLNTPADYEEALREAE